MATDFREKEQEFLDSLGPDTGRDLAAWMATIVQSGLTDRNAIIDFLRRQGFLFSRASWLERIHHNGGRPIYAGEPSPVIDRARLRRPRGHATTPQPREHETPRNTHAATQPPAGSLAPATAVATSTIASANSPETRIALDLVLAEAKAYRPLAQYVLREISAAVPTLIATPAAGYVALSHHALVAVLAISARELRLGLVSPNTTPPPPFGPARFPKSFAPVPAAITHAAVLDDARQVTPELIAAVKAAAGRPA
ncbi:MAG: hypothetical protein NW216_00865 [Hyphomicrobium sp.]|nr:hypothetical protein [Hyphomicrobium sp.]